MANETSQSSEQQLAELKEKCMQEEIAGKEPCEACAKLKEREEKRKKKQRTWMRVVVGVLLGVALLYVVLHEKMPGSQSNLLNEDDLAVMTSMLEQEKVKLDYDSSAVAIALKKELLADSALAANPDSLNRVFESKLDLIQFAQIDTATRDLILQYICTQYPPMQDCCQPDSVECDSVCTNCVDNKNVALERMIRTMPRHDVVESVKLMPVNSKSYFWLGGRLRYWEVILWSIFGVLCSLLYSGTEFMRKDQFRFKEVYVQVAKFFYTPLCAFIIVAGYDYFAADDASTAVVTVESPMGLIVMSFILGFFSGSTIDLLQRLKYVLFPSTQSSQGDTQNDDDQGTQRTIVNGNTGNDGGGGDNPPQEGGNETQDPPETDPPLEEPPATDPPVTDPPQETPTGSEHADDSNGVADSSGAPASADAQNGNASEVSTTNNEINSSGESTDEGIDLSDETGYESGDENLQNEP